MSQVPEKFAKHLLRQMYPTAKSENIYLRNLPFVYLDFVYALCRAVVANIDLFIYIQIGVEGHIF